jgi:hypothetical protein
MKTTFITLLFICIGFGSCITPKLTERKNHHVTCVGNKMYGITYNTYGLSDDHFIVLPDVNGLMTYKCNVDLTEIDVSFGSIMPAKNFILNLTSGNTFLIEGGEFQCVDQDGTRSLVRRIVSWNISSDATSTVILRVVPTRHDEIFKEASIGIQKMGYCDMSKVKGEVDESVCIGINSDSSCSSASKQIQFYNNKYLSITCSNCFLGFDADVFLELEIKWWHLKKLAGGLKNIKVNGALVTTLTSQQSWSAGVDKNIEIEKPTTIVDFNIGPIPIRVWFEIPLQITADLSFTGSETASIGANVDWNIGDAYLEWDKENHWTTVKPNPILNWGPVVSGSANFHASGNFAFIPTIKMHIDNVFDYTLIASTTMNIEVDGSASSMEICASSDADIDISGEVELHINIPLVHLGDKEFGPWTYYKKNIQVFPKKCVGVDK